jgi:uncharacterized protein YpuA (DUF1002 family)
MNHDTSYKISSIDISSLGDITFESLEAVTGKKTKETQKNRTKEILMEISEKTNTKIKIRLSEEETTYLSDITLNNFKSRICKVLNGC